MFASKWSELNLLPMAKNLQFDKLMKKDAAQKYTIIFLKQMSSKSLELLVVKQRHLIN